MSRLIVKNLPKNITEEKLRSLFGQKGVITDIQLKYTKEGKFRQFAFVGYQTEEEASTALNYFNNSCIQTSRIKVDVCVPLGAEEKPKSWSKYSTDSIAYKKQHGIIELEKQEKEKANEERKNKKKSRIEEILSEHKGDPNFIEFMQVHAKDRKLWGNDAALDNERITNEGESNDNLGNANNTILNINTKETKHEEDEVHESESSTSGKLANKEISDLQYMKSLIKKSETKNTSVDTKSNPSKQTLDLFTIKIQDIPYKTKRQDILKFFKPIKPYSVRLPTKVHGFCYVGFKTESAFKKAMLKNKSFLKGKQVLFSDFTEKNKISKMRHEKEEVCKETQRNPKWLKQEEAVKNEEDISESGRIFFRNLAYTITEDDLQKLFETYGPIAEINLPIDPLTRQIKGFGTVTFVMPEHAVRAFSELDGSLFHGRLLHLIPGKTRDNDEEEDANGMSFKAKKIAKLKKTAGSSHNWNTLFLGSNAVAEILAKTFETTKEKILDADSAGSSAAVRLALGETQIVMEMKKFLEENNVQLDVFNTEPTKRSKTVILAKNLPAGTTVAELMPLFSQYGLLGRIVLPPSGVTAIIEYLDSSEANQAFKKLAYSKFKNLPLYLEWAPENTFTTSSEQKGTKDQKSEEKSEKLLAQNETSKKENIQDRKKEILNEENTQDETEEDGPPEPETTLFIRNLNFKTREGAIREHFNKLGPIHIVQVAMKKDPENPKNRVSLGYGFIQFKKKKSAERALKEMQFTLIEGNQVELKRSDKILKVEPKSVRRQTNVSKQTGTKILVKNIPFQAKPNEIRDIFKVFGELKSVRLPKKMAPGEETHRGFGFVDFLTKGDAKKAFDALSQSTHLYGRRLVLEWATISDDDVVELRKRTAQNFVGSEDATKRSRKAVFDTDKIGNPVQEDELQ